MKVKGLFYNCIIASQTYASDNEHMNSIVSFQLDIKGQQHDLRVVVKQTIGSKFEEGLIEVGPPQGYKGPFNQAEFSKAVFTYYTSVIGPEGRLIKIKDCSNIGFRNLSFAFDMPFEIDIASSESGW